jgi:hypothetical protein
MTRREAQKQPMEQTVLAGSADKASAAGEGPTHQQFKPAAAWNWTRAGVTA